MKLQGSTALVTGSNRGLGREFVRQLLERGAKVYATARKPESVVIPGVEVLKLDITDPAEIKASAEAASDVDVLINNAGVATYQNLIKGDLDNTRLEMETHFFGTLGMVRAFAPVLAENGGGAILNVLSALSWLSYYGATSYCAAKAAEWSLTNSIRLELARQGTLVTGVHLGAADTDMMKSYDFVKSDPADVIRVSLDALEENRLEVIFDELATKAKAGLCIDPSVVYPGTVVKEN